MDRLWDSIEAFLAEERVELDDLELSGRTLRVVVDSQDGIDLATITELSRGVSRLLDDGDEFVPDSYNLEVTSPGLERTLRRPRHYEKSVGRAVRVKTTDGRTVRGRVSEVGETGFAVTDDGEDVRIAFSEVAKARTVFEDSANPKPGKKK